MTDPAYRRVIVKLSGEALAGGKEFGIDQATVERLAADLVAAAKLGVELGVVVGGGNIFRGVEVSARGVPRAVGDTMGMLATVMNCLVLEAAIERQGHEARTLSALAMTAVCETYNRKRAVKNLGKGRIVLLAAGTGNPYFTTDTTAVLRAAELDCQAVLKATNVDGVYTADPKKDPKAKRYERLCHQEAIEKDLQGHGRRRLRACPREPDAYHRFLDPRGGRDRGGAARQGQGHRRRLAANDRQRSTERPFRGNAMADATYDINEIKRRMQGAIAALKAELSGLRTGRASAHMLDPVMVEAYGAQMPLIQVASVTVPEPRLISVNVWDRSLVHAVEKAIVNSNLGLSPATEGQTLRLRIPELNEERRKELVKVAHKYAETARVAVRHVRRDGMDVVKKQEKDHKISKDDHDRFSADIQKVTDATISEIDHMLSAKEKEILTV